MQGTKILVIDDDFELCQSIKIGLLKEGATVCTAHDGRAGVRLFHEYRPDLVLLDIRLPEMSGWEVCRQIRLLSDVPIVMLTSLNKDNDIVRGLESGADDFVSKPCRHQVLVARLRAVLRRTEPLEQNHATYDDGYLAVDLDKRQVCTDGEPVQLTSTEFRLFAYLFEHAGQILPYENILTNVWGWEYQDDTNYVQVYMSHLRRKIEQDARRPVYLQNEHGVGYRFAKRDG